MRVKFKRKCDFLGSAWQLTMYKERPAGIKYPSGNLKGQGGLNPDQEEYFGSRHDT